MNDRRLRAYREPPWRAEEWWHWNGLADAAPTVDVPILFNGNRTVPEGMRGVVTACDLVCARANGFGSNEWLGVDLSTAITLTLKRSGIVVPGWSRRPSWWQPSLTDQAITTATTIDDWRFRVATDSLHLRFPLVVPIPLWAGNTLTQTINNLSGSQVVFGVMAQGYLWPAANEEQSGEGNLSDPMH